MLPSYNFDRDGFELTGSKPSRKARSSLHPRVLSHIKKDPAKKGVKADSDDRVKKDEKAIKDEKVKQEEKDIKDVVKEEIKKEIKDEIKKEIKEEVKKEVKEEESDDEAKKSGEESWESESSQDSEGEEAAFGQNSTSRPHHTKGRRSAAGGPERGTTYNSNFFGDGLYPKKTETIKRTFYAPPGWH